MNAWFDFLPMGHGRRRAILGQHARAHGVASAHRKRAARAGHPRRADHFPGFLKDPVFYGLPRDLAAKPSSWPQRHHSRGSRAHRGLRRSSLQYRRKPELAIIPIHRFNVRYMRHPDQAGPDLWPQHCQIHASPANRHHVLRRSTDPRSTSGNIIRNDHRTYYAKAQVLGIGQINQRLSCRAQKGAGLVIVQSHEGNLNTAVGVIYELNPLWAIGAKA